MLLSLPLAAWRAVRRPGTLGRAPVELLALAALGALVSPPRLAALRGAVALPLLAFRVARASRRAAARDEWTRGAVSPGARR